MEASSAAVTWLDELVWGVPMLVLLLGVGIYLTVGLRLRTIRELPFAFWMLWRGRVAGGHGGAALGEPGGPRLAGELDATVGVGDRLEHAGLPAHEA